MKTKAAILNKLHAPLLLRDIEVPSLKRGQVLVKILYTGICRAQYNEMIGLKGPDKFLPHLLGHEASGIVEKTGPGVTRVKEGDYCILSWIKGEGIDAGGSHYKYNGKTVNAGGVTTFSEYTVASENRITKAPRTLPPEVGAILGCAVVTGAGIINNTLKAKKGGTIAVFGAGGIGSSVILAARHKGFSKIIAVDVVKKKLSFAKRLGATHALAAGRAVAAKIQKIVPGGVDYCVDASGSRKAMEAGFDAIKVGGTLVIAGNLSSKEKISIHPFELIRGKKIIGTWGGETQPQRDIPRYIRAYLKGAFPIDKLITHQFSLKDINKAFSVLKKGEAGRIVIKVNAP